MRDKTLGHTISAAGGATALIAFLALPYLSSYGIISVTAVQVLALGLKTGTGTTLTYWLFAILPVLAAGELILGAVLARTSSALDNRVSRIWEWLLVAGAALFFLAFMLIALQVTATGDLAVLGSGFWIMLLSTFAMVGGSVLGRFSYA